MTHIAKPRIRHPGLKKNALGLTRRDYEGAMSTLCAGCGHDSVTGAIIESFWDLAIAPHHVAKLSGIGCSAKTPTYFLSEAHGFNSVHGRMPSVATGAKAANSALVTIGVTGDGDSLSIGIGQFAHVIRRNLDMLYVLENNGVYGLTKGQFSASADLGTKAKRGQENQDRPIDPVLLALSLGASFVARSFSGDKEQLVPIIQAGIRHKGFALIDVISPCVTFNDHQGSTKSYQYTRDHYNRLIYADFVPPAHEISATYDSGDVRTVQMHDGSEIRFRKVPEDYDPQDRDNVYSYIRGRQEAGEVATGLLYVEAPTDKPGDFHGVLGTTDDPLVNVPFESLCPGSEALDKLQERFR
ncbi:MAG: 2-oxoacid:ferredoxin oxidoreductase subunit beta [Longimicrobiales bacterium]